MRNSPVLAENQSLAHFPSLQAQDIPLDIQKHRIWRNLKNRVRNALYSRNPYQQNSTTKCPNPNPIVRTAVPKF